MLERVWAKANRQANAEHGTPMINLYNGLKHSFGCQRLNQGFSLDEVRAVMGHADLRTTGKYAKYATEKLSSVMRGKIKDLGKTLAKPQNAPSNVSE
jgi:site-specific recombinase XerD